MSYSPTTWANGDTITAAKLNNMESGISANENGWEVSSSSTELYSGSLTVSSNGGEVTIPSNIASALSSASTATITVDGTSYDLTGFDDDGYWTFGAPHGDFSTYSFSVYVSGAMSKFTHQTAGTYAVTVATSSTTITTTTNFDTAVQTAVAAALPFRIVPSTTTWQEAHDAMSAGRMAYAYNSNGRLCVAVYASTSSYSIGCITIMSTSTITTATFSASSANDVLTE